MSWVADYQRQWTYLMQIFAASWCLLSVRRITGLPCALFLWWFLAGGIATFQNSFGTYDYLDTPENRWFLLSIQAYSLDSIAKLFFVVVPMLWLAKNKEAFRLWGIRLALGFSVANCLVILSQFVASKDHCASNDCGGLIGNPSMSASFSVVALPLALLFPRAFAYLAALTIAAVFATRASSPVGLLAAFGCLFAFNSSGWRMRAILIGGALGALGAAYLLLGAELFNSGDRFLMWKTFVEHFTEHNSWRLGLGLGTFGQYAREIQAQYDIRTNSWWLWLHCDWIQLAMEGGIAGGALSALAWITSMYRAARPVAISLFLYGLMMVTNYPLHLATTAALGCWLLIVSHGQKSDRGAAWNGA